MSTKINTKFVGMTIVKLVLVIAGVFAASTAPQASAAAGGFVTGEGKGTLGCPIPYTFWVCTKRSEDRKLEQGLRKGTPVEMIIKKWNK